jgi:hypothetical protein
VFFSGAAEESFDMRNDRLAAAPLKNKWRNAVQNRNG